MSANRNVEKRESNTYLFLWKLFGIATVGVIMLIISELVSGYDWILAVVNALGSTIVASAIITGFWELAAKRRFADELHSLAGIDESVRRAGIVDVTMKFRDLDWESFFQNHIRVSLFISYGQTWRNNCRELIKQFLSKEGNEMRIFLPDPNDDAVMTELGRRFGVSAEETSKRIKDSLEDFISMDPKNNLKGRLQLFFVKEIAPLATYYVFDNIAIIASYNHARDRQPVPAIVVKNGGDLYDYVIAEMNRISSEASQHTQTNE
ncbi:hypothetical protein [Bremerella alba]|uniref:Uncharacterized protein n=1 Tax=Bremerella alba TaxID=980252 RepID=A0A7V8V8D0_9BACT|nr:hypothetical protein [Bremerella alba]MBA2116775.1 hypothetical protein [Bremerella alba]